MQPQLPHTKKIVLACAGILILLWVCVNFARITTDQYGILRFVLGAGFALLILLRNCDLSSGLSREEASGEVYLIAVIGTAGFIVGKVVSVNQVEWLGMLLLIYACLRWALPMRDRKDLMYTLVLLYWIHPLPV